MGKRVAPIALSEDQAKVVGDNLAMVYSALKKHKWIVREVGWDEAFSWACLVLCNAVRTHVPEKGAISTHFFAAINWQSRTYRDEIMRLKLERTETDQFSHTQSPDFRAMDGFQGTLFDERKMDDGWIDADELEPLLSVLTDREMAVVLMKSGIGDGHHYTLEQIGKVFGFTRSAAGQIHDKAMWKMRQAARTRESRQAA